MCSGRTWFLRAGVSTAARLPVAKPVVPYFRQSTGVGAAQTAGWRVGPEGTGAATASMT